jgi:hypothetical protein
MRYIKHFLFKCCCCNKRKAVREDSLGSAVRAVHSHGWASTSLTSKTAQHICGECYPKHPAYEPGRPFKQSILSDLFQLEGAK